MKSILITMALIATTAFADDTPVQTDLKFLCEVMKIEKSMQKDKSIDSAVFAERIHSIKESAIRDQATKSALSAISSADTKEHRGGLKNGASMI